MNSSHVRLRRTALALPLIAFLVLAVCPTPAGARSVLQVSTTHAESAYRVGMFEASHHPIPMAPGVPATERVIASGPVQDLKQGEVLQMSLDGAWTSNIDEYGWGNSQRWTSNIRHRVVLGTSPTDTSGIEIGAPLRDSVTPEQHHGQWQRTVTYSVGANMPGRRWVNVVARVEAEPGPNGSSGFTAGIAGWPPTWPFAVVEPTATTASIARWADETDSTSGRFVGLGRSVTLRQSTLPQDGTRWAVRTAELDLQPGDTVLLNAETNVEAPGWRTSGIQINDEIRIERPGSSDGDLAGPAAGPLTFDVLPPVDSKGASHQRYHDVHKRVAWRVPTSYPSGLYRFHHVLRASGSTSGPVYVGYGEIAALALRTAPVAWRARRDASPASPATTIGHVVVPEASRQTLTTGGQVSSWPSGIDRSAAASLRLTGMSHYCKQQPTAEYGPSTRPSDQRGAPRLSINAGSGPAVEPVAITNASQVATRQFPIAVSGTETLHLRLANPFYNPWRADGPSANQECTRGYTPWEAELLSAPTPATAAIDDNLSTGTTVHTSNTTAVTSLPADSANPALVHEIEIPDVAAGDRLLIAYHGNVDDNNALSSIPSSVTTSVTLTPAGGVPTTALRPTAENALPIARYMAVRRQGFWEAPSSWVTPRSVTMKVLMYASSTGATPVRIATTTSGAPYSYAQVLAIRAD